AADDKGFRHAIDAPFDRGAAVLVGAGGGEWITVAAEKPPRVVGIVLVIDADYAQALISRELHQERRLVVAGHAPRRQHIHSGAGAVEVRRADTGNRRAVAL